MGNNQQKDKIIAIILFLLPAMAGLLIFQLYPMLSAIRNSFFKINLLNIDKQTFVGLENFKKLLVDEHFGKSLLVTLEYTFLKVFIQVPIAFILALVCYQPKKGIGFIRTSLFAPTVTSSAIVAIIWTLMYHPSSGLINSILLKLGFKAQLFLISGTQALPSLVGMSLWMDIGFTMLIFLAGLQSINSELIEAASIDGANPFQRAWYVILPLLKSSIQYASITTTIFSFKAFTLVYIATQGGPFESTKVAVYYIWEQGFKFLHIGYASAMAVVLIVILIILSVLQNKILKPSHID